MCGVFKDSVPQLVVFGKTIDAATQLMLTSKGIETIKIFTFVFIITMLCAEGKIHASYETANILNDQPYLKITVNGKMELCVSFKIT